MVTELIRRYSFERDIRLTTRLLHTYNTDGRYFRERRDLDWFAFSSYSTKDIINCF